MPVGGNTGGGGGKSGKDVRAGGAFFEFFGKDNLTAVLEKLKKRALAFSSFMSKVGTASLAAGAGLAAPLVALFKGGADRAAEVGKLSQQFGVPVELMSKLQYAAERAGVSVEEVMKDTEGRFAQLVANAPAVSAADAAQALQIQSEMASATDALQQALMPLLTTVTPIVKMFASFVKENANIIRVLVPVAAGLVAFGVAAKVAALAVSGVVLAGGALVVGIKALLTPLGLTAAALAGLGYLFVTQTATGGRMFASLKSGFMSVLGTAKDALGGIGAALGKGDFALAGQIAIAALELAWAGAMAKFESAWASFKGVFVDGWHELTDGLAEPLENFWNKIEGVWDAVAGRVRAVVDELKGVWDGIAGEAQDAITGIGATFGAVISPAAAAFYAIRSLWDDVSGNVQENLLTLGTWFEKTFLKIRKFVDDCFRDMTVYALEFAASALRALKVADPTKFSSDALAWVEAKKGEVEAGRMDISDRLAGLDAARNLEVERLKAERDKAKKAREVARGEDVKAADEKVAEAERRLRELTGRAREPGAPPVPDRVPELQKQFQLAEAVKGTFSGAALGLQFGVSNHAAKQTELQRRIADNTERIEGHMDHLRDVFVIDG